MYNEALVIPSQGIIFSKSIGAIDFPANFNDVIVLSILEDCLVVLVNLNMDIEALLIVGERNLVIKSAWNTGGVSSGDEIYMH